MGFSDLIPLYGEKSTREKIYDLLSRMNKKITFEVVIAMLIMEAIKNAFLGKMLSATRSLLGAVVLFSSYVFLLEYGDSIARGLGFVREKAEEISEEADS